MYITVCGTYIKHCEHYRIHKFSYYSYIHVATDSVTKEQNIAIDSVTTQKNSRETSSETTEATVETGYGRNNNNKHTAKSW